MFLLVISQEPLLTSPYHCIATSIQASSGTVNPFLLPISDFLCFRNLHHRYFGDKDFLCCLNWPLTCHVAPAGLKLMLTLLPHPPECRDYRHVLLLPVLKSLLDTDQAHSGPSVLSCVVSCGHRKDISRSPVSTTLRESEFMQEQVTGFIFQFF